MIELSEVDAQTPLHVTSASSVSPKAGHGEKLLE